MKRTLTLKETDWWFSIEQIDNSSVRAVIYKNQLPGALKSTRVMIRHIDLMGIKTWMVPRALHALAKVLQEKYPDNEVNWKEVRDYINKWVEKNNGNSFVLNKDEGKRYTWI